jgi:hypothetical protein
MASSHPILASLMNDPAAGALPPLLNPTTSLQQAVQGNTLGVGYAGECMLCTRLPGAWCLHAPQCTPLPQRPWFAAHILHACMRAPPPNPPP